MATNYAISLSAVLSNVASAQFVTITTLTEPKMNKRGNPLFGRVVKFAVRNCQFGYDYENAVNNRLERQGCERSFSAEKLPWGQWLVPNKIITHKDNLYGRFYVAKDCVVKSAYLVDGRLATAEEMEIIKTFEVKRTSSARQEADGLFENQVKPYDVNLDNILAVKASGFEVIHPMFAEVSAKAE